MGKSEKEKLTDDEYWAQFSSRYDEGIEDYGGKLFLPIKLDVSIVYKDENDKELFRTSEEVSCDMESLNNFIEKTKNVIRLVDERRLQEEIL